MKRIALISLLAASVALPAPAQPAHCPPGLAKKTPACVPPGQARKGVTAREWRRGDRVAGYDYVIIRDWDRYRLDPPSRGEQYIRIADSLLKINRDTLEVITFIGLVALLSQ